MDIESVENFLEKHNITKTGREENGEYVITLKSSNEYMNLFNLLDADSTLELEEDAVLIGETSSVCNYVDKEYTISLIGDLLHDSYELKVKEN